MALTKVDKALIESVSVADLVTTGTADATTFLRGDNAWTAIASAGFNSVQTIPSSGTWTKPAGITSVRVQLVGGGGGGGAVGVRLFVERVQMIYTRTMESGPMKGMPTRRFSSGMNPQRMLMEEEADASRETTKLLQKHLEGGLAEGR